MQKNSDIALHIMGYVPSGYVVVCEICRFTHGAKYRIGTIYVDGIPVCGFKLSEVI